MEQADVEVATVEEPKEIECLSFDQASILDLALEGCDKLRGEMMKHFKIQSISELPAAHYERMYTRVLKEREKLLLEASNGS